MPFDRDLRKLLEATKDVSRSPAEMIERERKRSKAALKAATAEIEASKEEIAAAENRVERQRAIVRRMRERGLNSEVAEMLLTQFEDRLAERRVRLQRLIKEWQDR